MTEEAYAALDAVRHEFRALVEKWDADLPFLSDLQERLKRACGYDSYRVETPIVYNRALDELTETDSLSYILVADNPGQKEQLAINNRYLVGQSGKLAEGWFARELGIDFRKEVAVLNKTPLHTPKTAELKNLLALAGAPGSRERTMLESVFAESQRAMAQLALRLHAATRAPLWISGYGELGPRGLFHTYAETLAQGCKDGPQDLRSTIWVFRHFSMNQFAIELRQKRDPRKPLAEELARIGYENRARIFGW